MNLLYEIPDKETYTITALCVVYGGRELDL